MRIPQLIWLLIAIATLPGICSAQDNNAADANKKEAERAWEALVTAKGGREKLHSVRNMIVERYEGVWIQLSVFPDLEWEYLGPLGPRYPTRWSNIFDRKQALLVKATQDGEIETRSNYPWDWNLRDELAYILETKWDKPSIIGISRRKEGKQTLDVIEANIGLLKVEFGYEPEEMLVRRIYKYEGGHLYRIWAFDGYRSIDGIQMPSQIAELSAKEFLKKDKFDYAPISFQFNVDYDPKIFQRPLKSTTPDAWKRKN